MRERSGFINVKILLFYSFNIQIIVLFDKCLLYKGSKSWKKVIRESIPIRSLFMGYFFRRYLTVAIFVMQVLCHLLWLPLLYEYILLILCSLPNVSQPGVGFRFVFNAIAGTQSLWKLTRKTLSEYMPKKEALVPNCHVFLYLLLWVNWVIHWRNSVSNLFQSNNNPIIRWK